MFYFNLTTNYYKNEEKLQLLFEAAKSILGQLEIWCSVFWPIEHLSERHFAESNLGQSMFGWLRHLANSDVSPREVLLKGKAQYG